MKIKNSLPYMTEKGVYKKVECKKCKIFFVPDDNELFCYNCFIKRGDYSKNKHCKICNKLVSNKSKNYCKEHQNFDIKGKYKYLNKEIENKIIQDYINSDILIKFICKKYKISYSFFSKILKKNKIKLRGVGLNKLNEKNGMWKGDDVGYCALHNWIERKKLKPKFCEDCHKEKPYDLANISGKYKRDIKDFKWVCRRCHMKNDGRFFILEKSLIENNKNRKNKVIEQNKQNNFYCPYCKSFYVIKGSIRNDKRRYKCNKCKKRFSK